MKPPPFDYLAPTSLDEALKLLGDLGDGAKVLAGGQSLVPLLNFRLVRPQHLVDLNGLAELAGIREHDGHLVIGAMTRQRAVETSELVSDRWPLLAEACTASVACSVRRASNPEHSGGSRPSTTARKCRSCST